jgi:hypothetical protein
VLSLFLKITCHRYYSQITEEEDWGGKFFEFNWIEDHD